MELNLFQVSSIIMQNEDAPSDLSGARYKQGHACLLMLTNMHGHHYVQSLREITDNYLTTLWKNIYLYIYVCYYVPQINDLFFILQINSNKCKYMLSGLLAAN